MLKEQRALLLSQKLVLPAPIWQVGELLIIQAFGNIPPDICEWEIKQWKELYKLSKQIIESKIPKL